MGIIWTIVIGFVAGIIAKFILPGDNEPSGFILTTLLGIVGAFVASYLGQVLGWYGPEAGSVLAWIAARTFGVVVALAIVLEPMADNGSIVKMDQHVRTPFRMSLITDLAMKNAERRGDM